MIEHHTIGDALYSFAECLPIVVFFGGTVCLFGYIVKIENDSSVETARNEEALIADTSLWYAESELR